MSMNHHPKTNQAWKPLVFATTRLLLAAVGLASTGPAQSAEWDAAQLARIRPAMQRFVDQREIAGVVTVVGTADGIVSEEAVGWLNLEKQQPLPQDALFRIASMTKPITALGIMILTEEGKLSVEDPVEKHLPEFRGQMLVAERSADRVTLQPPTRPITLRDLLTHTSGLPHGYPPGLNDLYFRRDRTLAEATLVISQQPLQFEPGSRWTYCNSGIDTLGRVIEVVAGQPYEQFLAQRIFVPLGMTNTTFYPSPEQLSRSATLYQHKDGRLVDAGYELLGPTATAKHPIPAGGLYSTGADLARFYRLMLGRGQFDGQRLLSEVGVVEMTKLQTGDLREGLPPGRGFAFGWAYVREPQGVTAMLSPGSYGHGGAFGTQGWLDPQRGVFMIALFLRSDCDWENLDKIPFKLHHEFLGLACGALRNTVGPNPPSGNK